MTGVECSKVVVVAEALWAGTRSKLPVKGEAWFIGSSNEMSMRGLELMVALDKARSAYPAMFAPVERWDRHDGDFAIRLRMLEVYEDDVGAAGLSGVRHALEKRAQVCGLRIVAAINASQESTLFHGMPLDKNPDLCDQEHIVSMLEEIEIACSSESGSASRKSKSI
jgi:hypothetical protein